MSDAKFCKNGTALITNIDNYHIQETYCDCCGKLDQPETTETEIYYQDIITPENILNKDISVRAGGCMFLGNKEVLYYDFKKMGKHIAQKYILREQKTLKNDNARFICGMDLLPDGKIWVGLDKKIHNSFQELYKWLNKKGFSYEIYQEEDFKL